MKSHHQLGSPGGAGQAGEPGVGGPETLSRDAKSPLAELVRSGSCQHARRGRVSTLRHNSAIPQAAPRRSPGSCDIQKGRGGGGSAHRNPTSGQGTPRSTDSRPRRAWGEGTATGLGTSRHAACRRARAAARGQMGCINLGAVSSGPRCSVLSPRAGFGLQMWAWGGEGGWDTAPDVCSLSKG